MSIARTYQQERLYIENINDHSLRIKKGFVPNMNVEGVVYVNQPLELLLRDELASYCKRQAGNDKALAGFLPAVKQIANVAALPGIVRRAIGLPDVHSGYGFAIGNVAAFDTLNEKAVVSPGGIGFDINCGVRVLRTNLMEADVEEYKEEIAQQLFNHVPVGVGSRGIIPCNRANLEESLYLGLDWSVREGYAWVEDKEKCEEYGRMLMADPSAVSQRAKKRGLPQMGTLGAGNHYVEMQVVDEIYDDDAAKQMGIERVGQVCVMVHSGSRGLGHQVATDALQIMEKSDIKINDPQLACARVHSKAGQDYLKSMSCAANYAWVNRSSLTFLARQAFSRVFRMEPDDLDMNLIYDVSHNIAKFETHLIDDKPTPLLVHRKGSTRAFPPHHPLIPIEYQSCGQPVLIGGSMGTCSYVLTGTQKGFDETFGSTCHGAGRALSRNKARNSAMDYTTVLRKLNDQGIALRVSSPKLIAEESAEAYKDVTQVVDTCHRAGISKKTFKLRPLAVIKG